MQRKRILVVEDDAAIRQGVVDALEFEGFLVDEAEEGHAGLRQALETDCDLVLLDLVLPGPSGLEILREIRRQMPTLPVIILTALGEESQKVEGLRLGADDYIVKPFSLAELLARVEAVLRRTPERPDPVVEFRFPGGLADLRRNEILFDDGERVELSERESELLVYLARHAGRAISRQELLTRIWRVNPDRVETRTIDMHIARLREKLRDSGASQKILLTVRGKGYMVARFEEASS